MRHPLSEARPALRRLAAAGAFVLAACFALPAEAQRRAPHEEIAVGPVLLAPALDFSVDADSNVRRRSDADEDSSDVSTSIGASLFATLPFRRSSFELGIEAENVEYDKNTFASDVSAHYSAEFDLEFSNGQELSISDQFRRDFVQVRDPTIPVIDFENPPEEVFFGEPYDHNRLRIQFDQPASIGRGWILRVDREDFVYRGQELSGLYDYRGYEGLFQYLHPLSPGRRLLGHYEMRRFNHYQPEAGPECVGVPFRREVADSVELGLQGAARGDYLVRFGWGRFEYRRQGTNCHGDDLSGSSSSFRGLTGFARWRYPIGARTSLILIGSRRPLPSTLETYYTSNTLRLVGERVVAPALTASLEIGYDVSRYADAEATFGLNCTGTRSDQRWDARASAYWTLHRLFSTRLSYAHDERNSNCENSDYASDSVSVGLSLGW